MANQNMSNADRARIRQEAEDRRKAKDDKVFYTLVIITVAIIAVVVLTTLIRNAVTTPAEIRDLSAIEANWIVIDTDNKVSKHYHHPASFDIPAGYTKGDFTKYRDGVAQDFYLVADDPAAMVANLYVDAAPELTAEGYIQRSIEMRENALNPGSTVTVGEPFTATIAGEKAQCLYLRFTTEQGEYGCLLCGFDAPRNVCVTAILSGAYVTDGNVQTAEDLLAQAQTLLAGLTIIH